MSAAERAPSDHCFERERREGPMRFRSRCLCGWETTVHSTALEAVEQRHLVETMTEDSLPYPHSGDGEW